MVGIDTNILIYFLEKNPDHYEKSYALLNDLVKKDEEICISSLIFTEILSGTKNKDFFGLLLSSPFSLYDITQGVAVLAGRLRYNNKWLKTADALHIATAMYAGANRFYTNDKNLKKIRADIEIVNLA